MTLNAHATSGATVFGWLSGSGGLEFPELFGGDGSSPEERLSIVPTRLVPLVNLGRLAEDPGQPAPRFAAVLDNEDEEEDLDDEDDDLDEDEDEDLDDDEEDFDDDDEDSLDEDEDEDEYLDDEDEEDEEEE